MHERMGKEDEEYTDRQTDEYRYRWIDVCECACIRACVHVRVIVIVNMSE